MVKKRLDCKWSGFWMGLDYLKSNLQKGQISNVSVFQIPTLGSFSNAFDVWYSNGCVTRQSILIPDWCSNNSVSLDCFNIKIFLWARLVEFRPLFCLFWHLNKGLVQYSDDHSILFALFSELPDWSLGWVAWCQGYQWQVWLGLQIPHRKNRSQYH